MFNAEGFSTNLSWRTAANCDWANCVRVAPHGEKVVIGDSKQPNGPVLYYSLEEWTAFLQGVKNGEFDDIVKG